MKVPSWLNNFRRNTMHKLTKNVGNDLVNNMNAVDVANIKRILISRPNHRLGNMLLVTPLVQELTSTFPGCTIDLFTKGGLAPIIFENYPQVDVIMKLPKKPGKEFFKYINVWFQIRKYSYDLVINGDVGSSSGRLSTKYSKGKIKLFGDNSDENIETMPKDYIHFGKRQVYHLRRILFGLGVTKELNTSPIPLLDIKLTDDEIAKGKAILDGLVPNAKKTICLFTFATGKKCHSKEWWAEFYEAVTTTFPDYNFLEMLPVENVSQIDFKAKSFYSKDIREIAAVFHACAIFVGADSGMMHLASASKVTTIGLFNVTIPLKYEPYGNGSQAVNTTQTSIDQLIDIIKTNLSRN